jgi:hypothetical protein
MKRMKERGGEWVKLFQNWMSVEAGCVCVCLYVCKVVGLNRSRCCVLVLVCSGGGVREERC